MADEKPPPSEDEAAIAEIQGAAKWMVAALGGIAVVLVGGLTLGNLGQLDDGRLAAAVVGVGLAAVAIMYLLHLTLDVLVAEPVRIAQIADKDAARYGVTLLAPAAEPDELVGEIPLRVVAAQEAYQNWARAYFAEGDLKDAYYASLRQAEQWTNAGKRTVSRERLLQVQTEFNRFRDSVGVMGVFVLGGVALAAWGLTGPASEELTIASVQQTPTDVVVEFEPVEFAESVPEYAEIATEDCVNQEKAHPAVALSVEGQTYTLALVESDECPPVVVRVEPSQATVALPPEE